MRRYWIVGASTLLGIGAVSPPARARPAFGTQWSARSFAHVAQRSMRPPPRSAGEVAATSRGQLRQRLRFSHRNNDDPIVFPGKPGQSHDHTLLGNDTTNAFSTVTRSSARRLRAAARATPPRTGCRRCRRRAGSRSCRVRLRLLPPPHPCARAAFPQGFKLIAGNSKATSAQGLRVTSWNCGPIAGIRPQHDSDVPGRRPSGARAARPVPRLLGRGRPRQRRPPEPHGLLGEGRCPAGHAVAVPAIQVNVRYPTAGGAGLTLSSGGQLSGSRGLLQRVEPGRARSAGQRLSERATPLRAAVLAA